MSDQKKIDKTEPDKAMGIGGPLTEERHRLYIRDAIPNIQHFKFSKMTPQTLHEMLRELDKLVHYQIERRR